MFDPKILDDIAERLSALVPNSVTELEANVKQQIRSALVTVFDQLDLVTREEFDIQKEVLQRTRQKIEDLERQIRALEQIIKQS